MGTLTILAGGGVVLTHSPDVFKIQKVYAATSREVTVYPTNFLTYFQRSFLCKLKAQKEGFEPSRRY